MGIIGRLFVLSRKCSTLANYSIRSLSSGSETLNADRIINILRGKFGDAQIDVEDISGGCGAMFKVFVGSPEFKGKMKVQQHKLITEALKNERKSMHGIVIETKAL